MIRKVAFYILGLSSGFCLVAYIKSFFISLGILDGVESPMNNLKKKYRLSIALIAMFVCRQSHALWLGELTVSSHQGEPLKAQLILEDMGDIAQDQILVRVADVAEYDRLGLIRPVFLEDINFEFLFSEEITDSLIVTTKVPIDVGVFDLIVQANWNGESASNRYRVDIDLDPEALDQILPGLRYRISDNETLWSISKKIRSGDASINDVMRSIQRLNPQAFLDGDANGLIAGSIILLPTDDDLFADSEALEERVQVRVSTPDSSSYGTFNEVERQNVTKLPEIQKKDDSITTYLDEQAGVPDRTPNPELSMSKDELLDEIYILYERIQELEGKLKDSLARESSLESELEAISQEISESIYFNSREWIDAASDLRESLKELLVRATYLVKNSEMRHKLVAVVLTLILVSFTLFLFRRSKADQEQGMQLNFQESDRGLSNLKELKKDFSTVMDEVALLSDADSAETSNSTQYKREDSSEEEAVFAKEANPISSKLDLARAYIDMGDANSAGPLLDEIIEEGSDAQVDEARELIRRLRSL